MDLLPLIARYHSRGILVDANLLIIYLIGLYDERQLANCRATKIWTGRHAIATLAPNRFLVVTDEFALSGLLGRRGIAVIPFDHLRLAAEL